MAQALKEGTPRRGEGPRPESTHHRTRTGQPVTDNELATFRARLDAQGEALDLLDARLADLTDRLDAWQQETQ